MNSRMRVPQHAAATSEKVPARGAACMRLCIARSLSASRRSAMLPFPAARLPFAVAAVLPLCHNASHLRREYERRRPPRMA